MPELTQSPERYSYKEDRWLISATGSIPPVEILEDINADTEIRLEPGLKVPGVIVHVAGTKLYWASEELIETLNRDFETNPHYSYLFRTASGVSAASGSISGSLIGGTIPIITVQSEPLEARIEAAITRGKTAGVKSVEWPIKMPVDGEPEGTLVEKYEGLLEQVNWTLSPFADKPKDKYKIWDLTLSGNYTITEDTFAVDPNNPTAGLEARLRSITDRMNGIRKDFRVITDEFYFGYTPIGATTTSYNVLSSADSEEEDLMIDVKSKLPKQFIGLSTARTDALRDEIRDEILKSLPATTTRGNNTGVPLAAPPRGGSTSPNTSGGPRGGSGGSTSPNTSGGSRGGGVSPNENVTRTNPNSRR
jgi:hypothetical protein